MFLLFIVVICVHLLRQVFRHRTLLNSQECILIYAMLLVASVVPSRGLLAYLLTFMGSWHYYAAPENRWAELIHPHVKPWLVVQDEQAIKQFYEGMEAQGRIPWEAWLAPLASWLVFFLVLAFVMVCMMVILRKPWIEHERLAYPLTQLPLALSQGYVIRKENPFFGNPLMWIGFAIPMVLGSINALHDYYGVIPPVQLTPMIEMFRRTIRLHLWFSFGTIGFAYCISSPVAFSVWAFKLIGITLDGLARVIGIEGTERLDIFVDLGGASVHQAHQSMGAMLILVFYGIWTARQHLRQVLCKAFRVDPGGSGSSQSADDTEEMLSYRTAVFGIIGGLLLLTAWLWVAGLPLWAAVIFLGATFVLFLALTRAVCEAGIPVIRPAMSGSAFLISGFGSQAVGDEGLVQLAFNHSWAVDIRITVMAVMAHALRLMHGRKYYMRRVGIALVLAFLLSCVGGTVTILSMAYRHGAINLEDYFFLHYAQAPFTWMTYWMQSPSGPNWSGWMTKGLGMGVMAGLFSAWRMVPWWPLHPLGYALMGIAPMDYYWFSFFLAWMIKVLVLKYGGPNLYRKSLPFFLGLILGQFVCSGMWNILDQITGIRSGWLFPLM